MTPTPSARRTRLTARNRLGILLAALLGLADLLTVSLAGQPRAPGEAGAPDAVLYLGAVLGLLTIGAGAYAWWRSSRGALRAAAVARVLSLVLALPAFLMEGVASVYVAGTSVVLVLTLVAVSLLLSRR